MAGLEAFHGPIPQASLSLQGQAQLGCLFCPTESSTLKNRNELWAHLQTHSTLAFESDVDVVEGMMV